MTNAAASKWPHPPTNKKINGKKWPNWDPQLHLMLYLDNGIWSWGSYTVTLHCDCDEQQTQWGPGQGKRCCSVGFLCSFFSGSPSQVTFHLAGGGRGGHFSYHGSKQYRVHFHLTEILWRCKPRHFQTFELHWCIFPSLFPNQHVKSTSLYAQW